MPQMGKIRGIHVISGSGCIYMLKRTVIIAPKRLDKPARGSATPFMEGII